MLHIFSLVNAHWARHAFYYQRALKTGGNLGPARVMSSNPGRRMASASGGAIEVFIDCDAGVDDAQGEAGAHSADAGFRKSMRQKDARIRGSY